MLVGVPSLLALLTVSPLSFHSWSRVSHISLSLSFVVSPVSFHQPSAAFDSTSMFQMPIPSLFRKTCNYHSSLSDFLVLCQAALMFVSLELFGINWRAQDLLLRGLMLWFLFMRNPCTCKWCMSSAECMFVIDREFALYLHHSVSFTSFVSWWCVCVCVCVVQESQLWGASGTSQSECDWSRSAWHPAPVYQHSLQPEIHQQVNTRNIHTHHTLTGDAIHQCMYEVSTKTLVPLPHTSKHIHAHESIMEYDVCLHWSYRSHCHPVVIKGKREHFPSQCAHINFQNILSFSVGFIPKTWRACVCVRERIYWSALLNKSQMILIIHRWLLMFALQQSFIIFNLSFIFCATFQWLLRRAGLWVVHGGQWWQDSSRQALLRPAEGVFWGDRWCQESLCGRPWTPR